MGFNSGHLSTLALVVIAVVLTVALLAGWNLNFD
jgi:hypothetical protein